jgi:hypothetical protein
LVGKIKSFRNNWTKNAQIMLNYKFSWLVRGLSFYRVNQAEERLKWSKAKKLRYNLVERIQVLFARWIFKARTW